MDKYRSFVQKIISIVNYLKRFKLVMFDYYRSMIGYDL